MKVGEQDSISKVITANDIDQFAVITLDSNPIHLDNRFAEKTQFGERIAHGTLTGGLIGAVLGTKIPGPGTILLSQTLEFKNPVYINDEITASVTIKKIDVKNAKTFYHCDSICTNQNGVIVLEGKSLLIK
ncbi:MaoC family dehydratase [Sporosarcina sp. FSL K6-1508]|uniref:MaoC family dehydratase n=1 Tax=Sporosarcina sp. FSL K6-1508 TaxID=2921553 RepID=UPI0030FCD1E7